MTTRGTYWMPVTAVREYEDGEVWPKVTPERDGVHLRYEDGITAVVDWVTEAPALYYTEHDYEAVWSKLNPATPVFSGEQLPPSVRHLAACAAAALELVTQENPQAEPRLFSVTSWNERVTVQVWVTKLTRCFVEFDANVTAPVRHTYMHREAGVPVEVPSTCH